MESNISDLALEQPASSALRLRLFGLPQFVTQGQGHEQPLAATRPMQLLVYLAVRGSWQYRNDIAHLFWPDRTDKIAHSNLRNLLVKTAAAAPFVPLEANERALRLNIATDLAEFMSAVQQGNAERAVQIGAQELLPGFDGEATEPWQHWLQRERTSALGHWISAVQRLLAEPTRPIEQRAALSEQWAQRCPYDEDAVRARMAVAYEQGRDGVAASLYRSFSTLLQASFGVSASRELERFAHGASRAAPGAATAAATPAPAPGAARPVRVRRSSLVGRRFELKQLKALLAEPDKRLITLTGPGGVGKSALIGELYAQWIERDTDDSHAQAVLVDASAAATSTAVIAAIAEALNLQGLQGPGNEAGLAATLRDRAYLLMIDGAEQPGLAAPLALLIERCPNTRLLIASRSIVQLDGEQLFPLEGFPLPDADEDDAEALASNDGVHYFAEAMASAGQVVDLHHDAALIAELTRAVDGLPLALKLLAPLTRLFSLPQLLENVRQLEVVAPEDPPTDVPSLDELMPALVSSFKRSWSALSAQQQAALSRLAVFPASFDAAAACTVAATELPVIVSLTDRSLLRATSGRLSLHAGVRACVRAICPAPDSATAAYVAYYAERVAAHYETALSKSVRPRKQFIRDNDVHIEHAWNLAVQRKAYSDLMALARGLVKQIAPQGSSVEAGPWFVATNARLREEFFAPCTLRTRLLVGTAYHAYIQGDTELANQQARETLRLSRQTREIEPTFGALDVLFRVNIRRRELKAAAALLEKLTALQVTIADRGTVLMHGALLKFSQGDLESALRLYDQRITIARTLDDPDAVMAVLSNKAIFCSESGDRIRASLYMAQAVEVGFISGAAPADKVHHLIEAVHCSLALQEEASARAYADRADAIARRWPPPPQVHLSLQFTNATLAVLDGKLEVAGTDLVAVLDALSRGQMPFTSGYIFLVTAQWFRAAGAREACVDSLHAIDCNAPFNLAGINAAQAMLREMGEVPLRQPGDGAAKSKADITAAATLALKRLRSTLAELQRDGLQGRDSKA